MNIDTAAAWVACDWPGCSAGLTIDARHTRNFEGRSWSCSQHEAEVTC